VPDAGADEAAGTGAAQAVSTIPAADSARNTHPGRPWDISSRPSLMITNYPADLCASFRSDVTSISLNKHSLFARTRAIAA
jgi:hypothetical protein